MDDELRESVVRALNAAGLDTRDNLRGKSDEFLATALRSLSDGWEPVRRTIDNISQYRSNPMSNEHDFRRMSVEERLKNAATQAGAVEPHIDGLP